MSVILDNPHITTEVRAALRVVVVRRKATRPTTPAELISAYEASLELPDDSYAAWGLLIDTRLAPGRNDPDFEKAMSMLRRRASARFARVAVLVGSATGLLHSQRLQSESGSIDLITRDEDQALAFASG